MPDTPMSINAINYGADPTGAKDSTAAIQRAVDAVAARGGGSVELPRGIYRVSYPFIDIKHRVEIFGYGSSTVVIAHSDRAIPPPPTATPNTPACSTSQLHHPRLRQLQRQQAHAYGRTQPAHPH